MSRDQALKPFDVKPTGGFTRRQATHLLRRAGFGAGEGEIERALDEGLAATLDRLVDGVEEPASFQSTDALLRRTAMDSANIADLKSWWLYRMVYSANPLVEKMTLFWHNHFATSYSKVKSVPHMADQNDLIRRHAVGSFEKLLRGMTRDVAMLIWLDGNANRKRHPNENFAREVMELFSLDVGNYTEKDIAEAARAFTGWHVREDKFWFNTIQHDEGTKRVLGRAGNFDGDDIVDICLAQPACPRFLAKKLLRVFVLPNPDEKMTAQLATRIRASDLNMGPVLRELLRSRLFFSGQARHAIIKSPLDLVLGAHRTLGGSANLQTTSRLLAQLGQDVFEPPTVKGWDGGRLWITSASMLKRDNFAAELATGQRYGAIGQPIKVSEPEGIVDHYIELLLSRDLSAGARAELGAYLKKSQGNHGQRVRGLLHLIMTMPEFQLM